MLENVEKSKNSFGSIESSMSMCVFFVMSFLLSSIVANGFRANFHLDDGQCAQTSTRPEFDEGMEWVQDQFQGDTQDAQPHMGHGRFGPKLAKFVSTETPNIIYSLNMWLVIIPYIMENKTCLKPPTRYYTPYIIVGYVQQRKLQGHPQAPSQHKQNVFWQHGTKLPSGYLTVRHGIDGA